MKPVAPVDYFSQEYDTKARFITYWHQIQEILLLKPREVLEVGIGNGFVSKYLRQRVINIITLDVNKGLAPDVAGLVLNIPFPDKSFQVVACYEVLEHLPYEDFDEAVSEMCRVSKQYIVLSIPDVNRFYRIYIHIPKMGEFRKLMPLPRIRKPSHALDGQHHWEIGKAGYELKRIIHDVQKEQLRLEKTYRVYEMPYHRFFILRKQD